MSSVETFVYPVSGERPITKFRLSSAAGSVVDILDFGATMFRMCTPDRRGTPGDIVVGFDAPADHLAAHPHLGCVVGRCANRIAGSRFELDGVEFRLAPNAGTDHLHGGPGGFGQRWWDGTVLAGEAAVELRLVSDAGDQGYPGRVEAVARYSLDAAGVLRLALSAVTDAPTPVNLVAHPYFNLSDDADRGIADHVLTIAASRFLPMTDALLPTGDIAPVAGTPFDFRRGARLGDRLVANHAQIRQAGGLDHNLVPDGSGIRSAAILVDPVSGRTLELATDQAGLQLYTSNGLAIVGRHGVAWGRHSAICLETQAFPNAVNEPRFPTVILRPGERYRSVTEWRPGTTATGRVTGTTRP